MKSMMAVLTLCISFIFVSGCDMKSDSQLSESKQLVQDWLTDLKTGGDGNRYWSDTAKNLGWVVKLYAVRDWEILKEESIRIGDSQSFVPLVTVRVDSSTQAGIRITKIWNIKIIGKIRNVTEN